MLRCCASVHEEPRLAWSLGDAATTDEADLIREARNDVATTTTAPCTTDSLSRGCRLGRDDTENLSPFGSTESFYPAKPLD